MSHTLELYRRKGSSVWHYRGTLAPGCRLRGSTRTSDKETAQKLAAQIQRDFVNRRTATPQEILTFPKAVALYLGANKEQRFITKLVKHFGDVKISDMTSGSIKQAALDLYPKASNATRNRQVIVPTLAVINHSAELGHCPSIRIKRFKVDTKIKFPVTVEWIRQFRAHATRADIGALALFMFATGARISEALAVRWDDINMKKRTVLIRQTKLGNERNAHLPGDLFLALANLPRKAKPFNFAGKTSAQRSWERTIELAGIEPLTFHSCRHGFATTLLRRGVDVVTVAKLGGWKSPAHVFQTYGHANDDPTVTDRIFDTGIDTSMASSEENQ